MSTVHLNRWEIIPYIEKNNQYFLDDNDRDNIKKYYEACKPNYFVSGSCILLIIIGISLEIGYLVLGALLFFIIRSDIKSNKIRHYRHLVVNSVNAKIAAEEEARNKALREQKLRLELKMSIQRFLQQSLLRLFQNLGKIQTFQNKSFSKN